MQQLVCDMVMANTTPKELSSTTLLWSLQDKMKRDTCVK